MCQSLNKHHKEKKFYKTKGKNDKGRRSYIAWEEDKSSSSSSSSNSDDEHADLYLTTHKKIEDSEIYIFDSEVKSSYKKLSKMFSKMQANILSAFKKISHKRKLISKF